MLTMCICFYYMMELQAALTSMACMMEMVSCVVRVCSYVLLKFSVLMIMQAELLLMRGSGILLVCTSELVLANGGGFGNVWRYCYFPCKFQSGDDAAILLDGDISVCWMVFFLRRLDSEVFVCTLFDTRANRFPSLAFLMLS